MCAYHIQIPYYPIYLLFINNNRPIFILTIIMPPDQPNILKFVLPTSHTEVRISGIWLSFLHALLLRYDKVTIHKVKDLNTKKFLVHYTDLTVQCFNWSSWYDNFSKMQSWSHKPHCIEDYLSWYVNFSKMQSLNHTPHCIEDYLFQNMHIKQQDSVPILQFSFLTRIQWSKLKKSIIKRNIKCTTHNSQASFHKA